MQKLYPLLVLVTYLSLLNIQTLVLHVMQRLSEQFTVTNNFAINSVELDFFLKINTQNQRYSITYSSAFLYSLLLVKSLSGLRKYKSRYNIVDHVASTMMRRLRYHNGYSVIGLSS